MYSIVFIVFFYLDKMIERLIAGRYWSSDVAQCKREVQWMMDEIISRRSVGRPKKEQFSEKELQKLQYWINCRHRKKPLQYILNNQPFLSHKIIVRPPVLIPRWETEHWVDSLIQSINTKKKLKVIDICSGSGCISIALSHALQNSVIDSIDILPACIQLARSTRYNDR
jgi:HemK-like putative methylase